jgi:hypothetical protein
MECCGHSFCGQCYDYHVTHSCVKKLGVEEEKMPETRTFVIEEITYFKQRLGGPIDIASPER